MANTLNFNTIKKHYLTVTLADEKKTVLMISTPTKAIMTDIMILQAGLEELGEDESNIGITDDMYRACAKIMSHNKGGVKITAEYLEEHFDFEDIMIFFSA